MAIGDDASSGDGVALAPIDGTPMAPSIAEQKRQHAQDNPPPPSGDSVAFAPGEPPKPSILNSSWSQIGKQLWDEGTRQVGLGTRAMVQDFVGPMADLAYSAAGGTPPWKPPQPPPSQLIDRGLTAVGLPQPATPAEKNVSTLVGGATNAIPAMLSGGATSAPSVIRLAGQGAASAIAAKKALESDLVPQWLKPSAALVAGLGGGVGADAGWNLLAKGANAITGKVNDVYNAFKNLDIDTNLTGTVSGSPTMQSAEAAGTRMPFASAVVRPVQQRTVDQFGNAVGNTAAQLDPAGTAISAQATGENLQASARNWRDNVFPAQQKALWDPLDQRLAGTSVTPSGYTSALDSLIGKLNLPETQAALSPGLAMQLRLALTNDLKGGSMTWQQASDLRSLIGKTMGVPLIAQSVGGDALKSIYAGLAGDMRNTAAANGQAMRFDAANQFTTEGHAFQNGPLAKVISTNNPAQERIAPEQATGSVLSSGDTTMQAIRDRLPDAADQLAAWKLRQMQIAKPSVAGAYDDTSTGTFLSNVNRMRQNQPGGYDALYGNDPIVQQRLDDLQTAAGALRQTEKHLNTSGTSEGMAWLDYFKGIGKALSEGGASERAINTGYAIAGPPLFGRLAGKVITNPMLARTLAAQRAGPSPVPPQVTGILGSAPYW